MYEGFDRCMGFVDFMLKSLLELEGAVSSFGEENNTPCEEENLVENLGDIPVCTFTEVV